MTQASLLKPTRKTDAKYLRDQVQLAEQHKTSAAGSADTATTQAGIATTKANETVATASLAEGYKDSSLTNAQAAAAAVASIGDVSARVMPILKERGISNIKAIALKGAEGWEKQGNQSYKSEVRPAGRHLGDYASVQDAWAANKDGVASVVGDVYFDTVLGRQYQLYGTSPNGRLQNYRYGSDHLPLEAMFVVSGTGTNTRLMIFDLTDPIVPLWMEFEADNADLLAAAGSANFSGVSNPVFAEGELVVGFNTGANGSGLRRINFKNDTAFTYTATAKYQYAGSIRERNNGRGYKVTAGADIAHQYVNGVAVVDGYIAAATDGGLSVIKPDGTVVKSSSSGEFEAAAFHNGRLFAIRNGTPNGVWDFGQPEKLESSFTPVNTWTNATVPGLSASTLRDISNGCDSFLLLSDSTIDQLWPNPADYQSSLISRRGENYATPPMKKPELMLICGTDGGAISGVNPSVYLISSTTSYITTPNSVASQITGSIDIRVHIKPDYWIPSESVNGVILSKESDPSLRAYRFAISDAGILSLMLSPDGSSSVNVACSAPVGFSDGDDGWLRVTWDSSTKNIEFFTSTDGSAWTQLGITDTLNVASIAAINSRVDIGGRFGGTIGRYEGEYYKVEIYDGIDGTLALSFDAEDYNGGTTITSSATGEVWTPVVATISNQSADYSGKSANGRINGTLTATALTVGGVAGLSGFTTGNYLEAPNPWDGIGTGEGWLACAFKCTSSGDVESFIDLAYHNGSGYVDSRAWISVSGDGYLQFVASSNDYASYVIANSDSFYDDGLLHTVVIIKTTEGYVLTCDGAVLDSVDNGSHGNLSFNASAKTLIGKNWSGGATAPNSTIWFAGGGQTALSDVEVNLMHQHMRNLIEGKASLDEIPTSAAYDPIRQAVELVGDTYRQSLQDGAITSSVEHGQGSSATVAVGPRSEIGIGGSSSVEVSVPERNLRDRPLSLVTERRTVTYAGDATGSRVLFPDPTNDAEVAEVIGWRPLLVYDDGVEQTKGDADDYTIADYGLGRYCVEFATEPADGNNVDIVFEREVWK